MEASERESRQPVLLAVSNEIVRLYKEQFGRGPTKVRTDWAGSDLLICTLQNSFTPAERRLAAMGEFGRLRESRLFFQHATEEEFVGAVERLVGRKVIAFISGTDAKEDYSAEVFYLAPVEPST